MNFSQPFSIEFRWKEEIIYWEGDRGFAFFGGWGATPPITYVPDAETWDHVVPDWLRGRRDQVISRLNAERGHVLVATPDYSAPATPGREVFRK
jgi:hypothetical protein